MTDHPKSTTRTHSLGYPRIGEQRELKKATEAYWKGQISQEELQQTARRLRAENWEKQRKAGIDLIPCNDFSFYDQTLDLSCLVGNIPPRFGWKGETVDLDTRFLVARGARSTGKNFGHRGHGHRGQASNCYCNLKTPRQ
jgi:5-methyltetrahydropteroyltriglutamate--homocysteine methyltransferase